MRVWLWPEPPPTGFRLLIARVGLAAAVIGWVCVTIVFVLWLLAMVGVIDGPVP